MNCKHENTTSGEHYGFTGPVAVHPYTSENRAAHGGVTYDETCQDCGRTRAVNANGGRYEMGPWTGPTFAERAAAENESRRDAFAARALAALDRMDREEGGAL